MSDRSQTSSNRGTRQTGSVQSSFVGARSVHGSVLRLAGTTPATDEYVSILQIEDISYDMKSEEEQRLLNELYQGLLCTLSRPVQLLWRMLPLDLGPYLASFRSGQSVHL